MRSLTPCLCLIAVAVSSVACVAATRETEPRDSAAPPEAGSPDRAATTDASPDKMVAATLPDSGVDARRDASADVAADHAEAGKADSAADAADAADAVDAAMAPDASITCPAGETLCGTSCVDTQTDPDHCGDCTTVCPPVSGGSPACGAGTCGIVCDSGYHECSGACDANTSIESCGSSCAPCALPTNGTATCDGTSCGFTCDSGYHACGAACDSNTSIASCGSSCTPCAAPLNSVATCDGSACGFTCDSGFAVCGGGTACCATNYFAAGHAHTCAMLVSGVKCLGEGTSGQLGDGTADSTTGVDVAGLTGSVLSLTAGYDHTCAITTAGAYCWGDGTEGDLGNGSTSMSGTAVSVGAAAAAIVAMAAGYQHTCALLANGGVACWGDNASGQLGTGTTTNESTPQTVSGVSSAVAVAAGQAHTCAVTSSGSVLCWGSNSSGQLGNASVPTSSPTPVEVTGLAGAVAVTCGEKHTCALTSSGSVWCWGYGGDGELGSGGTTSSLTALEIPPTTQFGGVAVRAISAPPGGLHTCAITLAGAVWCWGGNGSGELGNGSTTNSAVPVPVSGISSDAVWVTTGDHHSCAWATGVGYALCWGADDEAQLGNDLETSSYTTPIEALDL